MSVPKNTGFYWARWMQATDDVSGGEHDYTPGPYEPVELVDYDDGKLKVEMLGSTPDQPPENFFWGPKIVPPERKTFEVAKTNDAFRKYKSMTPNEREEFLIKSRNSKWPPK